MMAQEKVRTARAEGDTASYKLQVADIKCRLAEIESQYEPLHEVTGGDLKIRKMILDTAFYVVIGRFPEKQE